MFFGGGFLFNQFAQKNSPVLSRPYIHCWYVQNVLNLLSHFLGMEIVSLSLVYYSIGVHNNERPLYSMKELVFIITCQKINCQKLTEGLLCCRPQRDQPRTERRKSTTWWVSVIACPLWILHFTIIAIPHKVNATTIWTFDAHSI